MEPVAYKLAYDVAVRSIEDQARVLEGLRSRAGTLFAATALVTSVTPEEAYRELALRYEAMYDFNALRVRVLMWFFRIAILCLVGEIGSWIVVLWRRSL